MNHIHSYGFGLATENSAGEIIEVFYAQFGLGDDTQFSATTLAACGLEAGQSGYVKLDDAARAQFAAQIGNLAASEKPLILCVLGSDSAPSSVAEAFLKLHLLSARLVRPHEVNLNGMFGVLHNLAWTSEGPIDLNELPERQLAARLQGKQLSVFSVDKFPKMTDYVVPRGVRIADTSRVRLGAYLGEGTTVMHEGFINFNAGTEGPAMIEGRISAGVMVGANSDLGGGCSTMGTLSGGGKQVIAVGENCLIGANAGIGIPLANGCVVEAGLYVTAGTKVNLLDAKGAPRTSCKAMDLIGQEGLLFRRNSLSGSVECLPLQSEVELNDELHAHN
jgi:2,3,4,5-tetrahydropyridine-2-carboxylate N-succinyltransferase